MTANVGKLVDALLGRPEATIRAEVEALVASKRSEIMAALQNNEPYDLVGPGEIHIRLKPKHPSKPAEPIPAEQHRA